jgi:hypothetical protein
MLLTVCGFCNKSVDNTTDTCVNNTIIKFPDGSELPAVVAQGTDPTNRCVFCAVRYGQHHHPGCIFEICPKCGDPLEQCTDLG